MTENRVEASDNPYVRKEEGGEDCDEDGNGCFSRIDDKSYRVGYIVTKVEDDNG